MQRVHEESCYGCRYAIEARNLPRHGEQVRCKMAEELFGGERWVNVRKGKNGDILKSKCGKFEQFQGDNSTAPEPKKEQKTCETCKGRGQIKISFLSGDKFMKCHTCEGTGKVDK